MDSAKRRAEYADARFVRTRAEKLSTRNGALDQLYSHESEGVGVRVRVGGAWGFAAARGGDRRDAEAALERALAVAAAPRSRPNRRRADCGRTRRSATRSRSPSRTSSPSWRQPTPGCAPSRA
jgi:predicted Zn-dependent protease